MRTEDIFVEWWPQLGVPGGLVVGVLLGVGVLVLVALGVLRVRREEPRRRAALIGLRVLSALAIWTMAVQPRWSSERVEHVRGQLAVLVDSSRSMSVARDGETRAEEAQSILEGWADDANEQGVLGYRFGSQLRATTWRELSAALESRDDETRLAGSITELIDAQEDLGGVVVVSDGADRGATEADLERLRQSGIRVHAMALGGDRELRDDAVAEVQADPVAFLRQNAEVRLVVRSLGGGGQIPVTLWQGEQVVREQTVNVPAGGEAEVTLGFTPRRLGRAVYRVSIPVARDDAVPANNERAFLVRVTRDKLRVLLVAGQPSWDVRFLRAFLKRDPSIDLISFFILRTTSDLTMAAPDELALIPFPTDELFREHLGSFDVVLFQNFDYGPYQMASYLPRIRNYVRRGGSFGMIGGDRSFGSGGYAGTPIDDVLPVSLPAEHAPPSQLIAETSFRPRLASELNRHPLVALLPDPSASAAIWARLATLEGINLVSGVREGAQVLMTHPSRRTQQGAEAPVLVLGRAAEGRVLALTADTSWRWGITTGGLTGDASVFERFWDRALRWLAKDPALEPARITTDRERYGPEGRVQVEAQLRDESYAPFESDVEIELRSSADDVLATGRRRPDGEGRVKLELEGPSQPGAYRVVARRVGEAESLCEEGFLVEAGGDELADPRPDPEMLARLAEISGGTFHQGTTPSLDQLDATRTRSLGSVRVEPFASAWAFLTVVGLLLFEWWLRRRWGLR